MEWCTSIWSANCLVLVLIFLRCRIYVHHNWALLVVAKILWLGDRRSVTCLSNLWHLWSRLKTGTVEEDVRLPLRTHQSEDDTDDDDDDYEDYEDWCCRAQPSCNEHFFCTDLTFSATVISFWYKWMWLPLPSARQHPSYGDCLEVKRKYYQNSCVLDCVTQCSQSAAHLCEQFLQVKQIGFVTLGPLRCA